MALPLLFTDRKVISFFCALFEMFLLWQPYMEKILVMIPDLFYSLFK